MSKTFHWTCPYCGRAATIGSENRSTNLHSFDCNNKDGRIGILTRVIVCPNEECLEYVIDAGLYNTQSIPGSGYRIVGGPIMGWDLRPRSRAKQFPEYVPTPILHDYEEACLILNLSPKSAATLCRRCLQGIIRDFWGIAEDRLIDEILELKERIDPTTWQAIDAVRTVGNIGAHMEKDINVIVDVDPKEADLLLNLIEILIKDWYINKHERQMHLQEIVKLGKKKRQERNKEERSSAQSVGEVADEGDSTDQSTVQQESEPGSMKDAD